MAVQPPDGLLGSDRLNSSSLGSMNRPHYRLSTDDPIDTHGPPTRTPTRTVAATTFADAFLNVRGPQPAPETASRRSFWPRSHPCGGGRHL